MDYPGGGVMVQKYIRELPLLPLRGLLVFPYMVINLDVGREKSIKAIEEAMIKDKHIFLASQKEAAIDDPEEEDIYSIGTIAEIKHTIKLHGGTLRVLVEGIGRGEITQYIDDGSERYIKAEIKEFIDEEVQDEEIEAIVRSIIFHFERYIKLSKQLPLESLVGVISLEEPGRLADVVASHMLLKIEEKQKIMEAVNLKDRLEIIYGYLLKELEILELENKISARVRNQMDKTQREYYLKEQIKAINQELGDKDDRTAEVEEYREKIEEANLPEEVETKVLKEVTKLEKMPPMVAEATVVRNYLDWILDLPWNEITEDSLDIDKAEEILNEDHYGLANPKERILEFLAVRKLVNKIQGPIICLVGPPGVGKTSLAKSMARSLGRKFVRISLGGVRDEAEIRGHRRTYVGAMPGRIIQGMKNAGTKNPIFLLDEIDKMSMDFRGDPSAALLEVLDPEQNTTFSDHYIEIPFDLSDVMFITTANVIHNIPRPLLDRMEVIRIPGYTEEEKVNIAEKYLVPRQLEKHGLDNEMCNISKQTLLQIVRTYTRESGVRNLEREIANICRKVAKVIVKDMDKKVKVTVKNLNKYLGIPRFHYGTTEKDNEVGVATGLAWTEVGGDILQIEVSLLAGKGKLLLTGKLGEVMKESAQAGFSYIRSIAEKLKIETDFHEKYDIHIHVPEGAIPKDGPSAGITMATALASALSKKKIKKDVAMTGEITLRGRVLPVGGIKEKVLAAHRAGSKIIIIPKENEKDLEDIPMNVRKQLEFVLAEHLDEVLEKALVEE